jgi:preprotein translocase subunit SecA
LRNEWLELKYRAQSGESLNSLVVPCFALIKEASQRTVGMSHFDVQLMAGAHLVSDCIVEMATGEGKTLTALLPLALHSLRGKGAHLATANDYLAKRDGTEMSPIFELLGISVGIIQHESTNEERRVAYPADVTYGTVTEFGFDFLRDRMKTRWIKRNRLESGVDSNRRNVEPVCRPMNFILVDEADSIMIDDASTPLIIGAETSASNEKEIQLFLWSASCADRFREGQNFRFIEHQKKVELNEDGRRLVRQLGATSSVSGLAAVDQYEHIERAIKVRRNYFRDRNYVVNDGQVTIVDENTGRLAVGRFWQDGLHQAIQAREGLEITIPTASAARVTLQSLILSYPQRSGMTGTAVSASREFRKVYKLSVISVPTRKRCLRRAKPTVFTNSEKEKLIRIRDSVAELAKTGRPVLIGSRSVAKSEKLAELFQDANIGHRVLNARNESSEAEIVARAGQPGHVTISTSMAGRGTDIKLGENVESLGGLHVIIAELNDAQRLDRQLIGRCARQSFRWRSAPN